ncbi:AraC family transcriptional regulator [Cohnella soli]|uniref:AraC family transcriptional regulator n=1 Tax=Cohnella soli TaxID=425005 RepID=A0ABW0HU62_9BACL
MSKLNDPLIRLNNAGSELYYHFSGEAHCSSGYCWGPGIRNEYIFHYITSGSGKYKVNGEIYDLQAGHGFVIFPQTPVYYEASEASPWHYIWIGFTGRLASDFLHRAGITDTHPIFQPSELSDDVHRFIKELLTADSDKPNQELLLMSYLYRFIWALCESKITGTTRAEATGYRAMEQHMTRAFDYIYRNYSEPFTISGMAKHVGVDRKHLHAIFIKACQLSPKNYVTWYRMKIASELLQRNDLKVGEVARSVGYHDSLQFSKAFRKHYGKSPTEWRRDLK